MMRLSPYVRLVMDGPGRGWVRAEDREEAQS